QLSFLTRRQYGGPACQCRRCGASDLGLGLQDLAAAILAGLEVDVVGAAALARLLVLDVDGRGQRVGRPAAPALHARHFLPGDCHLALLQSRRRGPWQWPMGPVHRPPAYSGIPRAWPDTTTRSVGSR